MEDYFNFPNAAADGGPPGPGLGEVDASVSFDVVWGGPVKRHVAVRDAANGFTGLFVEDQATVTWSAREGPSALFPSGFRFRADPGSFATSVPEAAPIAELGFEANGIFFPGGSGSRAAALSESGIDAALVRALEDSERRLESGAAHHAASDQAFAELAGRARPDATGR